MANIIQLSDLTFENDNSNNEEKVIFNNYEFFIKKHISIMEKINLIDNILQDSLTLQGTFNTVAVRAYFTLYTIIYYSNLVIDTNAVPKALDILDEMIQSGLAANILQRIPKKELDDLEDMLKKEQQKRLQYSLSFAGVVQSLINQLPMQVEGMKEIINNFDKNKFQEVIDFAKAVNNNKIPD